MRRKEDWKALRKVLRDEANLLPKLLMGACLAGAWWKARNALEGIDVCFSAELTAKGRRNTNAMLSLDVLSWLCVRKVDLKQRQQQKLW